MQEYAHNLNPLAGLRRVGLALAAGIGREICMKQRDDWGTTGWPPAGCQPDENAAWELCTLKWCDCDYLLSIKVLWWRSKRGSHTTQWHNTASSRWSVCNKVIMWVHWNPFFKKEWQRDRHRDRKNDEGWNSTTLMIVQSVQGDLLSGVYEAKARWFAIRRVAIRCDTLRLLFTDTGRNRPKCHCTPIKSPATVTDSY